MKTIDYSELKEHIDQYISGGVTAADLKHSAAPFGIYQQRNDLFMIRIRIVGGEIDACKLRTISKVMKKFDVGYSHITTRQDLQLHDVKAENIYEIVLKLTDEGMPFRGGGGNTFRNIVVSPESGISEDSVFDVYPYAKALNEYMMHYDKAFDLPRKLKIGFASSETDSIHADLQDLGFIARNYRDEKGFKVYAAGGMGRESRYGVKLFNCLPPNKVAQCAKAITDLFYDHGDRENRNQARLRYVLNRLGDDGFISLFQDYYLRSAAELPAFEISGLDQTLVLKKCDPPMQSLKGFEEWKEYAVSPTRFGDDIVSVRLFVPQGNLNCKDIQRIVDLIDETDSPFLRTSQTQDIILPLIHKSKLEKIFGILSDEFSDIDLGLRSFKGHILSCVGAEVCKIGVVHAPRFADTVAEKLDEFFKSKPSEKAEFINTRLSDIRISGCPNTCSGHFSSKIALCGMKKKIDGELVEGVMLKEEGIEKERFVPAPQVPEAVIKALLI